MNNWLGKDDVLILRGTPTCEPRQLGRVLEPLGLEAGITTRFGLVEHEIKLLLVEKGVSYLWQLVQNQEDFLGRTPDREPLLEVLRKMLVRLAPTEELTIVDRYLLPSACSDCVNDLVFVLTPIIAAISRVVIVTSQKHDARQLTALRERLGGNCEIVLRISEEFHDRFWIVDGARGLFVGTSLNGIGKRYALADYMQEADVRAIIEALPQPEVGNLGRGRGRTGPHHFRRGGRAGGIRAPYAEFPGVRANAAATHRADRGGLCSFGGRHHGR